LRANVVKNVNDGDEPPLIDRTFPIHVVRVAVPYISTSTTMTTKASTSMELVPMSTIIATSALCVIGLLGNCMVILATIISPTLKNRCNILMCVLAITDLVVCIYLIQLRIMMWHRWYFQANGDCFIYTAYGLFAMNVQSGIGLMLGVDRLLAVSLPIGRVTISMCSEQMETPPRVVSLVIVDS
ncbi:hypothetical protein OSTOST_14395, partial [Ostertagia ostertagi]